MLCYTTPGLHRIPLGGSSDTTGTTCRKALFLLHVLRTLLRTPQPDVSLAVCEEGVEDLELEGVGSFLQGRHVWAEGSKASRNLKAHDISRLPLGPFGACLRLTLEL